MKKVRILNDEYTYYKKGAIAEMYSADEIMNMPDVTEFEKQAVSTFVDVISRICDSKSVYPSISVIRSR